MYIFYSFFIFLLRLGINILSLFSKKAKKGLNGRRESLFLVKKAFTKEDKVLWMHAASLGEYEQGLPILKKLKKEFPQYKILITLFSPSGYEAISKKEHLADVICYLPFDNQKDIQNFISQFTLKILIIVKYDYWFTLLREVKKEGAKIFVISALFYEKHVFFKPWGKWMLRQLRKNIDWFFHQTEISCTLVKRLGIHQSSVSGDTRYDRVKEIKNQDIYIPFIKEFKKDKKLIILGSSWKSEEEILKKISKKIPDACFIIAPHNLQRINTIQSDFKEETILYSAVTSSKDLDKHILIIDSVGILSKLYFYADLAVVGGGFHKRGLHNILEAAIYGIPVIFGSKYRKNPEADALIREKGGIACDNETNASDEIIKLMNNDTYRKKMGENAEKFIKKQPYSTQIITEKIQKLTS